MVSVTMPPDREVHHGQADPDDGQHLHRDAAAGAEKTAPRRRGSGRGAGRSAMHASPARRGCARPRRCAPARRTRPGRAGRRRARAEAGPGPGRARRRRRACPRAHRLGHAAMHGTTDRDTVRSRDRPPVRCTHAHFRICWRWVRGTDTGTGSTRRPRARPAARAAAGDRARRARRVPGARGRRRAADLVARPAVRRRTHVHRRARDRAWRWPRSTAARAGRPRRPAHLRALPGRGAGRAGQRGAAVRGGRLGAGRGRAAVRRPAGRAGPAGDARRRGRPGRQPRRVRPAAATARKESLNLRGAYLEVLADTLGSVGVLVAGAVTLLRSAGATPTRSWPSGSGCSCCRAPGRWAGRRCASSCRPRRPHVDVAADPRRAGPRWTGVLDVHDVHVWTLTSGMEVGSAHLEVDAACDPAAVLSARAAAAHRAPPASRTSPCRSSRPGRAPGARAQLVAAGSPG